MFNVNVVGGVNTTRALLPSLKRSALATGSGRIIFVSSQVAQAPIYGYSAYAASKWAVRGLAEVLNMELKPYGIYVSVAYPPDTNTPGYENEMESKPEITKKISESGSVFSSKEVASDIVASSTAGYFNISTGLDGWMLRQLHPGMSPVNNLFECIQPVLFAPLSRIISIIYVLSWDQMAAEEVSKNDKKGTEDKKKK
jgi:3-dehydrosphinganine reductase